MFKVDCFVDDKNVAKLMHSLSGLAVNLQVVPVRNVKKSSNGKLESTAAGTTGEAIVQFASDNKLTVMTPKLVSEALKIHGFATGGQSSAITNAVKAKLLKKTKKRGQYVVNTAKEG